MYMIQYYTDQRGGAP